MGNQWGNPCISHMVKYIIGWELGGKKARIYGESMSPNFSVSPHTIDFVAFSGAMGHHWRNLCIYHMLKHTIGWKSEGKKQPYHGESISTNFPGSPHTMGCVAFSRAMRNWWENPCISHMIRFFNFFLWIEWEKNTHTIGKEWVPISKVFRIQLVLLHFPVIWEIDRKTNAFPIWWDLLIFSCERFCASKN